MAKDQSSEDYFEDSTMQELHQIREEMERQQEASGLSYLEWLQATEPDLRKSLAEDGFRMIKRNGRIFMHEIKPRLKKNNKYRTLPKVGDRNSVVVSTPPKTKMGNHKNYDDYIKNSTVQEFQGVREDRASPDKSEPQPQKQPVKYKHKAVSNSGSSASRKKRAK